MCRAGNADDCLSRAFVCIGVEHNGQLDNAANQILNVVLFSRNIYCISSEKGSNLITSVVATKCIYYFLWL
jgi:hypothetical protein